MSWKKRRTRHDSMWGLITGPLKVGYGLTRLVSDNVRPEKPKQTRTAQVRVHKRTQSTPPPTTRAPAKRMTKQQRVIAELAEWTEEDERLAAIYPQPIYRAPDPTERFLRACGKVALFVLLLPIWFVWEGLHFFTRAALWFVLRGLATVRRDRTAPPTPRAPQNGADSVTEDAEDLFA